MKSKSFLIALALGLIFAGAGFYGGMKYQLSKEPAFLRNGTVSGARTGGNRNGMATGFRPVTGVVVNADSGSITVKLADGSSKIILLNSSTQISQATKASVDDLKTGITVAAFGQQNSDGSISAQTIQINPQDLRPTGQQGTQPTPAQ